MQDTLRHKNLEAFVKRYDDKPFLLIFKTIDMCKNIGDAFDALEDLNLEFPMTFDIENNKWAPAILLENEIKQGAL
jgi:hypothetical protein